MRSVLTIAVTVGAVLASATAEAQISRSRGEQQRPQGDIKVAPKEEKRFPLGASWIAISLNGKSFQGNERPAFTLDEQFRVRGFGGCNAFQTTAFPTREQGLAVGPLALTKRSCPTAIMNEERAFLTALRTAGKWDTIVGSLVIRGPNGELKFERSL